ncbi:SusD/RagB family nutrient-binding outer membrane lipoprotein [Membranihabitans marinus]|uniref:SusD/RagB family nutrient-binding outer membrane lipoprotein n=1 Tax=Membranihabitans marinus TaxID=1227546 RepID=UPI001F27FE10|nr:SusD/RagB family nutrient-binding outer membrane lipoprotein [Membranihabitans marinus]
MKYLYNILIVVFSISIFSCEDFEEVNTSPNDPEVVSSNFVLTYVLTETAKLYTGESGISSNIAGAMQYTQKGTQFNNSGPNYYAWSNESWSGYYNVLRNNQIIYNSAVEQDHAFFEAVSLVMRAYIFGFVADLYGDVPFSEALQASEDIFFPKYDDQKDVYVGVLSDLKKANELLSSVNTSNSPIDASADIYYGGNPDKWRRFANSLRLRYVLRLDNKKSEISELNLESEFQDAAQFVFQSNDDNAIMEYIGTTEDNAAPGGLLRSSNPNFALKPAATLINQLVSTSDPRLERWVNPVLRKWDTSVSEVTTTTVTNIFGDEYTVELVPTNDETLDTDLYVGLPIGLPSLDAINYNIGDDDEFFNPERNPHISYLHDRFRMNYEELVNIKLMTYSEVQFILAEAALIGSYGVSGSPETYYRNGILASMNDWNVIQGASSFDFDAFYNQPSVDYSSASNPLERILTQKWLSSFESAEAWFDWRRTGYPNLQPGEVTEFGDALPIRFVYPSPNLDPSYLVNYEAAINKLEVTNFVPVGQSKDHAYSRMWLLQGTGKPW